MQKVDPEASRKYKGVHFGNMTSKRSDFRGAPGPGPGEYEPLNRESQILAENVNFKEEERKRFEAKIPRYHELITNEEEKKVEKILSGNLLLFEFDEISE